MQTSSALGSGIGSAGMIGGLAGFPAQGCPPQEASQVEHALMRLKDLVEQSQGLIHQLGEKLHGVVVPYGVPPSGGQTAQAKEAEKCPLAGCMDDLSKMLSNTLDQGKALLNAIQL